MASTARIDELKKKFDENPRRYFAPLANEFRKGGDADQAIMICEEFLPQQPGHMSGHIVYGQALFDLNRLDEARTVFETALTLDPENLIALRHLGDIARAGGDVESARQWYERVLEADPRNEEVQQVIGSLGESARFEPEPEPSAAQATTPPPMDFAAMERAETATVATDVAPPEHAEPLATPTTAEPAVIGEAEFLELEMVDQELPATAEGYEPMEFEAPSSSMERIDGFGDVLESGEFNAPSSPIEPLAGLEETAVGAFERIPEGDTEPSPLPDLERSARDEEIPVDIPPEVIAAEAELLDARGESEPATAGELDDSYEVEHAEVREAALADTRIHPTPSQPFVTETMAELYVKQGFRDQALDVYKLLLAASPDNARLQERVAELQPDVAADRGPNVRDFFALIAGRRPGSRAAASAPPSDDDFAAFETLPESGTTGSAASTASSEPVSASEEPLAERSADGSIDALFAHRPVGTSEDSAASALAQAFGAGDASPPITGRPARAATGELSLDSVFRDGGARPPRGSQSFSFDQFFSDSAAAESADEPASTQTPSQGMGAQGGEPAEQSADDIEQFNSWLQGLKQR